MIIAVVSTEESTENTLLLNGTELLSLTPTMKHNMPSLTLYRKQLTITKLNE